MFSSMAENFESSTLVPGMCEAALSGGMIGPIDEPAKIPSALAAGNVVLAIFLALFVVCSFNIGLILLKSICSSFCKIFLVYTCIFFYPKYH